MPKSISSTVTSIDATRRKLIVGIVIATLMVLAIAIADLASGGRPDPPALRAAATLLDGVWRFHTGDDQHWADANTDEVGRPRLLKRLGEIHRLLSFHTRWGLQLQEAVVQLALSS